MTVFRTFVATVLFSGLYAGSCKCKRMKRANSDTFDILLNLYRVNPLSKSSVFKTFSNTILLPTKDSEGTVNYDSESAENSKDIEAKLIEETIHIDPPSNTTVHDKVTYPPRTKPEAIDALNDVIDFSTGFELGTDLKTNTDDVTQMWPAAKMLSLAEEFIPIENIIVPINETENFIFQTNVVNSDEANN